MTLIKKSMFITVFAVGCVGIGLALYNWYYTYYIWPVEIQRSVAGGQLAPASALVNYDGFSAYGQGAHRWRYEAVESARLREKCAARPILGCHFTLTRRLNSDVQQTVSFRAGVLVVEEIWN